MTTISVTPPIRPPQVTEAPAAQHAPASASGSEAKPTSAIYFSPAVQIDPVTEQAVWVVRDPETGAVIRQFPRDATIRAYLAQSSSAGTPTPDKEVGVGSQIEGSK